jgi:hypothetical protein
MSTDYKGDSPSGRAMDEAIELDLEGCSPYPKRASFIDADTPYVGKEIRRSVAEDLAIVLVEADGSTLTLWTEPMLDRQRGFFAVFAGMKSMLKTRRAARKSPDPPSLRERAMSGTLQV